MGVVIQSFRSYDVPTWITRCMQTVRKWAVDNGHEYICMGDEFLTLAPPWYREKAGRLITIVTDLARLILARDILSSQADLVIWMDADLLMFAPDHLILPSSVPFAYSEEIILNRDHTGALGIRRRVNNAVCMFAQSGLEHLDEYIYACARNVADARHLYDNAEVGTKLLSVAHRRLSFPLISSVGLFDPVIIDAILEQDLDIITTLENAHEGRLAAANLCNSIRSASNERMETALAHLLRNAGIRKIA